MKEIKMMISALFAFIHFLAAFGIAACILFMWQTMSMSLTHAESRKIEFAHTLYNVCAAMVVVAGGLRVVYFEKGLAFYMANPFFYAKLIVFLLIGALVI